MEHHNLRAELWLGGCNTVHEGATPYAETSVDDNKDFKKHVRKARHRLQCQVTQEVLVPSSLPGNHAGERYFKKMHCSQCGKDHFRHLSSVLAYQETQVDKAVDVIGTPSTGD